LLFMYPMFNEINNSDILDFVTNIYVDIQCLRRSKWLHKYIVVWFYHSIMSVADI